MDKDNSNIERQKYQLMKKGFEDISKKIDKLEKEKDDSDKIQKISIEGVSIVTIKGDKGEDGKTPSDEKLISLIRPLIPKVENGKTPTDKELLTLIKPLIPKVKDGETPSDEKLLSLIRPLIPEPIKIDTNKLSEDASDKAVDRIKKFILPRETAEEIGDKINTLYEYIDAKAIKNLPKPIQNVYTGGVRSVDTLQDVTNRGATTTNTINVPAIEFQTTYTPTGLEPIGTDYWDADRHCKTTVLEYGSTLQNGFELLKFGTDEGNDFPEGFAVSTKGTTGNRTAFELTDASATSTNFDGYIGLITTAPDSGNRFVTREGDVNSINTTGSGANKLCFNDEVWNEGDTLFVDCYHPGYLSKVEPQAPCKRIRVGQIDIKHAVEGRIALLRRVGVDFTQLNDVNGTPLTTDGQIPVWHNTEKYFDFTKNINDYWKSDGSSTATGDWDLGTYDITATKGTIKEDLAVGTTTGKVIVGNVSGNARGANALDIQSVRTAVTQVASGNSATSVGSNNTASGGYASAIGSSNTATGIASSSLGYLNTSSNYFSYAIGGKNTASGLKSTASGYYNESTGQRTTTVGNNNTATVDDCTAVGTGNQATGDGSTACGYQNLTSGSASSVLGYSNQATKIYSTASGCYNNANGIGSTASGYVNTASGYYSTAVGYNNTSSGQYSGNTFGSGNTASNDYATAIGSRNTVSGKYSTACGYSNNVSSSSGIYSGAFGSKNVVSAAQAFAIGANLTNSTAYSVDVGISNTSKITIYSTGDLLVRGRLLEQGTFGNIHVHDSGAGAQSIATGTTYIKLTCFTDNGFCRNVTCNATNDKITITKTGYYKVSGQLSFSSGTNNVEWQVSAFLNGTEQDQAHFSRKIGTAGDIGSGSFVGIIQVSTANLDLDMRARHDSISSVNITVEYGQLVVEYLGEI